MVFGKKPIKCKLGDLGEARSMYTQTNVLTGTNCTTAVHRESLAFMVPELMIEELSMASLNPDQSCPFQHDLDDTPNRVTSNMKVVSKQQLQKQAYPSFILNYILLVHAMVYTGN